MPYATITGQLKDSDGTAWKRATWTAVPVSPSSKPVFPDGSPVPTTSGLLDDTGHFSGQIPQTIDLRPPGTTLTVTITSMTSAPPLTLTKVQIVSTAVDLGALLSPRIPAPRIKSSAIVYAYNSPEVTNPVHGNGYVNTTEEVSYIYMQNSWVKIGASPVFDTITASGKVEGEFFTAFGSGTVDANAATFDYGGPNFGGRLISRSGDGTFGKVVLAGIDGTTGAAYREYLTGAPAGLTLWNGACFIDGTTGTVHANAGLQVTGDATVTNTMLAHCVMANGLMQRPAYAFAGLGMASDGGSPVFDMNHEGAGPDSSWWRDVAWGDQKRFCTVSDAGVETPYMVVGRLGALANLISLIATRIEGNLFVNGTIGASGAKTFNIPHPLGGERRLVHACLEGPENGVYYRGEAELVDGRAIVELPAYFEALTQADGRTVQLTQVDDGGDLGLFAASPVVDGKFSIRSNVSAALVSWEVKAERRDLPRLDVEPATKGERSESES